MPNLNLPAIRDSVAALVEANKSDVTSGLTISGIGKEIQQIETTPFENPTRFYYVAVWIPEPDIYSQARGAITVVETPVSVILVDEVSERDIKKADDNFDVVVGRLVDIFRSNTITADTRGFDLWPQDINRYKPVHVSKTARKTLDSPTDLKLGATITFTIRGC